MYLHIFRLVSDYPLQIFTLRILNYFLKVTSIILTTRLNSSHCNDKRGTHPFFKTLYKFNSDILIFFTNLGIISNLIKRRQRTENLHEIEFIVVNKPNHNHDWHPLDTHNLFRFNHVNLRLFKGYY